MSDWVSYEARLTEGYRRCSKLTWRYGTTYFWGAGLLPKPQRKHVHAVYALCRLAVNLVDLRIGQHPIDPERDPTPTEPGTTPADQDSPVIEPALGHTPAEPGAVPTEPDPTVPHPVEPNASIACAARGLRGAAPDQLGRRRQYRPGDGSCGSHGHHMRHRPGVLRPPFQRHGN